jgi:hypothetical protein
VWAWAWALAGGEMWGVCGSEGCGAWVEVKGVGHVWK